MMRTASSSVSGTGVSVTRAPSLRCRSIHSRKLRREPPPASVKALACATMKRYLRHCSRLRGVSDRSGHQRPLTNEPVDQCCDRGPHPALVIVTERLQSFGYWAALYTRASEIVEAATSLVEPEQVDVGTGEGWGAECGHYRDLVGRIVYRTEAVEQVADLLGIEDQRAALQPVRDARIVERDLEVSQSGTRGHQDADVRIPRGSVLRRPTALTRSDLPATIGNLT